MKSQIMKSNCKDEDYEIEKAPKRCNYKKIKLDVLDWKFRLSKK